LCGENNYIQRLPGTNPPAHSSHYKTFSTIYSAGHGFHILEGDANSSVNGNSWHDLWFDWNDQTLASALTNAGSQRALRVHDPHAWWPHNLLPNIYHGPAYVAKGFGGLTGELAIFLALIAMSMEPEMLLNELPRLTQSGQWGAHGCPHGRQSFSLFVNQITNICVGSDKRGVVVYVYTWGNNQDELKALEDGRRGCYYE
jgi:hypothetical protein